MKASEIRNLSAEEIVIKIQDLNFDGLEILEAKNIVVATVKMTRAAATASADAAAEAK